MLRIRTDFSACTTFGSTLGTRREQGTVLLDDLSSGTVPSLFWVVIISRQATRRSLVYLSLMFFLMCSFFQRLCCSTFLKICQTRSKDPSSLATSRLTAANSKTETFPNTGKTETKTDPGADSQETCEDHEHFSYFLSGKASRLGSPKRPLILRLLSVQRQRHKQKPNLKSWALAISKDWQVNNILAQKFVDLEIPDWRLFLCYFLLAPAGTTNLWTLSSWDFVRHHRTLSSRR